MAQNTKIQNMLERLNVILSGCAHGKCALDSDCIKGLNRHWQPLKKECALTKIAGLLWNAPFKFVQKLKSCHIQWSKSNMLGSPRSWRRWLLVLQYNSADYRQHITPMFYVEPCIYGHRILSHAASMFAAVRHMPAPPNYHAGWPDETVDDGGGGGGEQEATGQRRCGRSAAKKSRSQPTFDFRSRAEKRLTFTLVFRTLKCEIHMYSLLRPGMGAKYTCSCMYVCMYVCLFVYSLAYLENSPNFIKFSVLVICHRGSVFLWRQCDMLCTSGFVDYAMFPYNGGNRSKSKSTRMFRPVLQIAAPVERQTPLFDRDR